MLKDRKTDHRQTDRQMDIQTRTNRQHTYTARQTDRQIQTNIHKDRDRYRQTDIHSQIDRQTYRERDRQNCKMFKLDRMYIVHSTWRSSLAPVLLSTSISSDCARKSLKTGDNLSGCASSGVPFVAIKYKAYKNNMRYEVMSIMWDDLSRNLSEPF